MRSTKVIQKDQELIQRFLDVLGGASTILLNSKIAGPGLFIIAHSVIHGLIENDFFKKEELLIQALEANGFPVDDGPIGAMRAEPPGTSSSRRTIPDRRWRILGSRLKQRPRWSRPDILWMSTPKTVPLP